MAEEEGGVKVNHMLEAIKDDLQPDEEFITLHDPKQIDPGADKAKTIEERVQLLNGGGMWTDARVIDKAVFKDGTPCKEGVVTIVGKRVEQTQG